jgi:hypothetical protein
MASASILQLDLTTALVANPTPGRIEDAYYLDTSNNLVKHKRAAFPISSSVASPELVWEFVLPTTYGGATGFTCVFFYHAEIPVIAGNVVWELAAQRVRSANASDLVNADSWGTPATTTDTVPSVVAELKKVSLALVKANVGGANTPAAGDLVRFRLRRLNTNASDTCTCTVYLISNPDLQDT